LLGLAWFGQSWVQPWLDEQGKVNIMHFRQSRDNRNLATLQLYRLSLINYIGDGLNQLLPKQQKSQIELLYRRLEKDYDSILKNMVLSLNVAK
jgi:hypothetical protein